MVISKFVDLIKKEKSKRSDDCLKVATYKHPNKSSFALEYGSASTGPTFLQTFSSLPMISKQGCMWATPNPEFRVFRVPSRYAHPAIMCLMNKGKNKLSNRKKLLENRRSIDSKVMNVEMTQKVQGVF